jgi:uncharacterized HAD superfamily protein
MTENTQKIIKVGFDLDGVILYNPLPLLRPIFKAARTIMSGKKAIGSFVPKTPAEEFMNNFFIRASMFVAPGLQDIKKLVEDKKIKAYIITARHSKLKQGYEKWVSKINAQGDFEGCYYNSNDLEPFEFKKKMIRDLQLDVFIEDNWDVVQALNNYQGVKVFWISNIFDRGIQYVYKFKNLIEAVRKLNNINPA